LICEGGFCEVDGKLVRVREMWDGRGRKGEEAYDFLVIWMIWGSSSAQTKPYHLSLLIHIVPKREHGRKKNPDSLGRKLFPIIFYDI
jgi:hypothetical protein